MASNHIVYAYKLSTNIDAFESVAMNENLSKNDLRVFMFLCCRLGSKHLGKIDADQLSESLNVPKKKIKESIENLINECILARDSDEHFKTGYRLCYTDNFDGGSDY